MTRLRALVRLAALGALGVLALAASAHPAAAQDGPRRRVDLPGVAGLKVSATPELATRLAYDDNLLFQGIEGYEALVAPSLRVRAENERTRAEMAGRVDVFSHPDHGELERMNRRLDLDVSHGVTRRVAALGTARVMFDKSFEEALDQEGVAVRQRSRRNAMVSPGISLMATERDRLVLRLPFEAARHDGREDADFSTFGARAHWRHALGDRRTATVVEAADERRVYDTGEERIRTLLPGVEHAFTERTRASIMAGVAASEADFSRGGGSGRDWLGIARAELAHRGEVWNVLLGAARESIRGSGGESLRRDRLTARGAYGLGPRLEARLRLVAQRSRTAGWTGESDTLMFGGGGELAYELGEDTTFVMGVERTVLDDRVLDKNKTRNRAFLGLTWAWPDID